MTLLDLIIQPKQLDRIPKWNLDVDANRSTFLETLIISGTTFGGLFLRGKASKIRIDRDVMFQLEYDVPHNGKLPLWRIDWLPFHNHTNDAKCPAELQFTTFTSSHSHEFILNFVRDEDRMRSGNLPVANFMNPNPSNYMELHDFSAKALNITNLTNLLPPKWVPDLFRA